ncbi:MAG: GntR family transcriptional regulator, partial [Desulfobacterales bacterium]|nr:GntR family transcriptional regulator [Desulfobacterales bacterium]
MIKEKICETLRKYIIDGELSPGERLLESELCKKFGVSRGPIREALNQLMSEGFVTIIPNKGATVAKISLQDLKDFYILLAMLERKAIEWSIPYITESDVKELIRINESIKEVLTSGDKQKVKNWSEQNVVFHRFFRERCGNSKLGWLVNEIRQRTFRYRYTIASIKAYDDFLNDHEEITVNDVIKAFELLQIDELGLNKKDRCYLTILNEYGSSTLNVI